MTHLAEHIAGIETQQDSIARQFAHPEDTITHLQFYNEQIVTFYSGTKIERRGIGSSFVIGDSLYAVLGTATPQPYLGDSRVAFATLLDQFTGSPFVNSGLIQIRDMILGSATAISPTLLLVGSGTFVWNGSIQNLSGQSTTITATRVGQDVQWGSFIGTISSAISPGGNFTEMAISGGRLFTYDSFTSQTLGANGSEIRFNAIFRIGS